MAFRYAQKSSENFLVIFPGLPEPCSSHQFVSFLLKVIFSISRPAERYPWVPYSLAVSRWLLFHPNILPVFLAYTDFYVFSSLPEEVIRLKSRGKQLNVGVQSVLGKNEPYSHLLWLKNLKVSHFPCTHNLLSQKFWILTELNWSSGFSKC